MVEIPMVTELDAEGEGKIGAQLATYAKLSRKAASGPVQAASKAGREFIRMVQLVGQGQSSRRPSRSRLHKLIVLFSGRSSSQLVPSDSASIVYLAEI